LRKNMYNLLSFKFIFINVILGLFFGLVAANDQGLKTPIEISQLNFKLTPIEKTWLKNHQSIKIGGPRSFPPFHYFEKNGDLKGISADYIIMIMDQLGVTVEVQKDLPWPEVLKKARSGEIDLIPCIAKTSEREAFLSFSSPYLSFPLVIISRKDSFFIGGIEDLHDKKLAIINKVSTNEWLKRDGIQFFPYYVDSPLKGLESVSLGQADARIENLAAATYLIQKNGLTNLKVAAPTPYGNYDLHMAVGKGSLELLSIINKSLETIPPEKHMQIRNKLLSVRFEYGINKAYIAKWIFGITGVAILIIGFVLFWNRRLKTEVTYQKKIEENLLKSENRLQATLDATPFPVAVVDDQDDKILYWSRSASILFGHTAPTVSEWYKIAYPDSDYRNERIKHWKPYLEIARESKLPVNTGECEISCKDGTICTCELYATFIPENIVITFNDITEPKQAIEALRKSEENYKALAENPNSIVMRFDPKGNILFVNQYACQLFGYSFKEMMGKKSTDLIHPEIQDDGQRAEDLFANFLNHPERFQTNENVNLTKDGKRLWISWANTPTYDESGQLTGLICTGFDTTDKKHMEKQLQQAQKMESIGTLAGGIAHDFNNILFPILGHAEMLLTDIPEDGPFRDEIKAIHTSALRAKDLVKQILTFSRQDANELKLMKIQPIVKEALKLIRSTIPTTIEIKQDINADCGAIKADPTQIHQIVMNLTTNAYHAMEETGGELKVSLKQIKLEPLDLMYPKMAPGVYACLIVADTGAGMDKNVTDKIFDPFFTTKAIGKGTGMGLSVVHGIVTSLEGAIQVYSEQGKGTKFHVYFPIEKNSLKKLATHSKTQIQGGTEQILLVDDEEAILTMEKQMLERLGYQVTSRVSSLEALEAFRANPGRFDIVITDMAMPNMAGDKLSDELTKIRTDIPVLLCTGFSETMSEEKATSLGIKGFIFKPIVMQDFAQKIREVLNKNKSDEAN